MGLRLREGLVTHHPRRSVQSHTRMMIDLDRILYPEPVAAGMDIYTIASLTKFYRCANEHTTPITVRKEGDYWRLVDGRHRTTASMMAGRKQVLATEEEA